MKRTIIGAALLLCGTIGVSTQRVIDAIFTANDWQLSHSGFNLLYGISLTALVIGVILCIISAIPVIIAGAMRASDLVCVICVCVLLVFVAGAVLLFITAGMVHDSFLKLLQEEEYSVEKKKVAKKYNGIIGAYWLIMVAIYLGWSFYTNKWDFTWIIWPVAGVLFAAIMGILRTIDGNKNN